jgi:hypothetical protein
MNTPFENEVAKRFGVMPNFFRLSSSDPRSRQISWGFAQFAYCIARHVGFLVGLGYPADDSSWLAAEGGIHSAFAAASPSAWGRIAAPFRRLR